MIQSGYHQLFEYEAPRFTWWRGQQCRVVLEPALEVGPDDFSSEEVNRVLSDDSSSEEVKRVLLEEEHPVLVCKGEDEDYQPLVDEPDAYLRFARMATVPLSASSDGELADGIVEFAERFGVPCDAEGHRFYESLGLPLALFRWEAIQIAAAIGLLSAISEAEHDGDWRPLRKLIPPERRVDFRGVNRGDSLLFVSRLGLCFDFHKRLKGVRLYPFVRLPGLLGRRLDQRRGAGPDLASGGIVPQYTCDDLLTAMWLQVYFAATERRIVRERCKGCGRPFEAKDQRQQYCDPYCRRATNQRNYYSREKRKQKEAQGEQES